MRKWIKGQRVQIDPSYDLWAMGARYGYVRKNGRKWTYVHLDNTGRTHKFDPDKLTAVEFPYHDENGRMVYVCCLSLDTCEHRKATQ